MRGQKQALDEELVVKQAEYDTKAATFREEIELYNEVIEIYKTGVWSNDEEFKARQDDYIEDGDFDNGDYADRDVPKIKTIAEEENGVDNP